MRLDGLRGADLQLTVPEGRRELRLGLAGVPNLYNALAAVTAARRLGVGPDAIARTLEAARPPFGRAETIRVGQRTLFLQLSKNPVGVNQALELIAGLPDHGPVHLWLGLGDGAADGRDVSWIWDAGYERLAARVGAVTCSGPRAAEMAVRVKYAGWPGPIAVEPDVGRSLRGALAAAPQTLYGLATYTQLLALRPVLTALGVPVTDWGSSARRAVPAEFG